VKVLALDLARLTGWAVGDTTTGEVESFGRHEFPRTEVGVLGEYGMAARVGFRAMLETIRPGLVVYEQPILRSGKIETNARGRQFVKTVDTPAKLRKIYGLGFELEVECYLAEIPVEERNISEVRRAFLSGKVPRKSDDAKLAVKVMCRRLNWNIIDDNEADALAVLSLILLEQNPKAARRTLGAGTSATMSSSGLAVFASSRLASPRHMSTATARPGDIGDGSAVASLTERKSPGTITAITRRSAEVTRSTLSAAPARQLSLELKQRNDRSKGR
jgi:hypothetical protein